MYICICIYTYNEGTAGSSEATHIGKEAQRPKWERRRATQGEPRSDADKKRSEARQSQATGWEAKGSDVQKQSKAAMEAETAQRKLKKANQRKRIVSKSRYI